MSIHLLCLVNTLLPVRRIFLTICHCKIHLCQQGMSSIAVRTSINRVHLRKQISSLLQVGNHLLICILYRSTWHVKCGTGDRTYSQWHTAKGTYQIKVHHTSQQMSLALSTCFKHVRSATTINLVEQVVAVGYNAIMRFKVATNILIVWFRFLSLHVVIRCTCVGACATSRTEDGCIV